ncbi:MAG: hypothetical protein ABSF34_12720, partial [Verrucomicrobiota bacterium]
PQLLVQRVKKADLLQCRNGRVYKKRAQLFASVPGGKKIRELRFNGCRTPTFNMSTSPAPRWRTNP